jgi:methyl-accepting chemotaxis protein
MNWFKRLTVGTRLTLGFLIVSVIGGFIGFEGLQKAGQINDLATQMYARETMGLSHTAEANMQLLSATRALRSAMLSFTEEDREHALKNLAEHLEQADRELGRAEKFFATADGQALIAAARTAFTAYEKSTRETAALLRTEPLSDARAATQKLFTVMVPLANRVDELMGQALQRKKADASRLSEETDRIYAGVRTSLILLTVVGVIAGIALGTLISRALTRQLGGEPQDVADMAVAIAAGRLDTRLDTRRAEPGSVVHAMARMQQGLREVVGTVRISSDSIATGARQIATGTADLSQRTEEQASNLQQTAASMEQLSSTVQNNAEAARRVSDLAGGASDVALQGGKIVGQVITTMEEINTASERIADIIGLIDGIAFQTNILALNAAVEAARAGEQGRGFAVVASEVRALSKRSADAAKEIKALITDSVTKVALGRRLVDQASSTMDDIVDQVRRVTALTAEISAATTEQTAGLGQISGAVQQLDQVTQQNAALVEESAAAADSLDHQTRQLVQAVAVFHLGPQHIA